MRDSVRRFLSSPIGPIAIGLAFGGLMVTMASLIVKLLEEFK